jgi:circadian clock protein KaiC
MTDVSVPVPRLRTGVSGLDQITLGGLPANRTTLVVGTTGTGKTLLALEFIVRGIEQSAENGVFVTFEERPEDIRRNAAALGLDVERFEAEGKFLFLDASEEPDGEQIVGAYDFGGLEARVTAAVRRVGATRVSFDSLGVIFSRFADAAAVRSALQGLSEALRRLEVTSLLTAERADEYGPISRFNVEEYVADNVVILRNVLEDEKRRRTLEVLKLRGAPHRTGEWLFTIDTTDGLVVLPLSVLGPGLPASRERVTTGVAELDEMCGGGFLRDTVAFVAGPTGAGKTLLATEFVAAGTAGAERCLLYTFEEGREQLLRNALGWGFDLEAMEAAGTLRIVCEYPELASLEDHFLGVKHAIEEFHPTRVAIDNLSALERIATLRGIRDIFIGLGAFVKRRQITALFTATRGSVGRRSITESHLSTLTDTILLLRYAEIDSQLRRSITVMKMRGSRHDPTIREFTIDDAGMQIGGPLPSTGPALDASLSEGG